MEKNLEDKNGLPVEWERVTGASSTESVQEALSPEHLELWALVLLARSIPCRLENEGSLHSLLVPKKYLVQAEDELLLFEEENRNWPPQEPPTRPLAENTLSTISVLILLATFHNITILDIPYIWGRPVDWVASGSANAAMIQAGQWWRIVTALTLHSGGVHLISNLSIGGIFVFFLCRDLGAGLAWALILGSGILGNLVNAWFQHPEHISVGASTAVFGAVGILAALSMVRYRHHLRRRWLLPLAAALALLALLGTEGKQTDIAAHLLGFFYGVSLGLPAEYLTGRYGIPGRRVNALLSLASIEIVFVAWWLALVHS